MHSPRSLIKKMAELDYHNINLAIVNRIKKPIYGFHYRYAQRIFWQ